MGTVLGLLGTGDWVTDQRPKSWREAILRLYPNGSAPLTGLTSKLASEKVTDPEYYWWTKSLPAQGGSVTGVYTDVGLSSAYTSGATAGTILYVKMAEAQAEELREGHEILLRDASDYTVDCVGKVVSVVKNGASSYAAVKLLEADDNSTSHDLSDCDTFLIIGNLNAEGAEMPDAISYQPSKFYNYTQIFRTPLSITRTAMRTKLRTGEQYKESKREALELHSIEMEKAFFWGIKSENTGNNGKPERSTEGLIPFIKTYASSNCSDFTIDPVYTASKWLDDGEAWLDEKLEVIFRYGSTEKLAFCGSGALLGLNAIVKNKGQFSFTPKTIAYGIKVTEWTTPFGSIYLKTHPLFSYNATNRNSIVILEPSLIKYRYIDDTTFYAEGEKQNTGRRRVDGIDEEYLTECGLEIHHPSAFGYLNGVGLDNILQS